MTTKSRASSYEGGRENSRVYNIYLCPKCKSFAVDYAPPRIGWCNKNKANPMPVIQAKGCPLVGPPPACTLYVFKGKR